MIDTKQPGLHSAPQPLYQKVKHHIQNAISTGQLSPDDRVPSENELAERFMVSRMTVNRALRELSAEGVLVRIQGVGTFVASRRPQSSLLEIGSIAEEIHRQGGIHSSAVHLLRGEPASLEIAKRMALAPRDEIFHAVLVHYDRTLPVQVADHYVNPAVAPLFLEQDFSRITPNDYLMKITPITAVDPVIEAVLADKRTQSLLNLKKNTPCLMLQRTTWHGKTVATHSRFIYPGPRFLLGSRFTPGETAPPQ